MKLHLLACVSGRMLVIALLGLVVNPQEAAAAVPTRSALTPLDGATSVSTSTTLTIRFSIPVVAGTGNIELKRTNNPLNVQSFDVATSGSITGWNTETITITLSTLTANTAYYVNYPATAFKDANSSDYAVAVTDGTTWNFTTGGVPWSSGDGTSGSPWQITTCLQLISIDAQSAYWNDFFILSNDIDCAGTTVYPMRIGTGNDQFTGSINGNSKKIQNLTVTCPTDQCGLFARVTGGASFTNLTLENVTINHTSTVHTGVGPLFGVQSGSSTSAVTISNITATGLNLTNATAFTGGIAGDCETCVTTNVSTAGNITGKNQIGGVYGQLGNSSLTTAVTMTDVSSSATITGTLGSTSSAQHVGGLVGSYTIGSSADAANRTLSNLAFSGSVTGDSSDVGGIIGNIDNGVITGANSSGSVTGHDDVGGLFGDADGTTITRSRSSGTITASRTDNCSGQVGGLIGTMSTSSVATSFSTATVRGYCRIGGLIGGATPTASSTFIDNSYFTGQLVQRASGLYSGNAMGGLVGVSNATATIARSYAAVTSVSNASSNTFKGLIGEKNSAGQTITCTNVYWDQEVTSITTDGTCGTGPRRSTSDMKTQATFTGFDFNSTWLLDAGSNSGYPVLRAFITDTTAPTAQTLSPADDATGVALDTNLVVTFSENVTAVSSKYIRICTGTASCTGSTVSGDVVQVLEATNAAVTISTNQVTINPATDLSPNTTYYVSVDSGAFRDSASNNYAGLSAGSSWNFDTGARTALVHLRASDYTAGSTSWTNQGSLTTSANITTASGGMTKTTINGADAVVFAGKESSNSDRVSGTIGSTAPLNEVTVEMWLYMDDGGSAQNASGSMYFSWEQAAGSNNYNVYHFNDRLGFNSFKGEALSFDAASLYGSWRHMVFVMSDSTSTATSQKIFINGVDQSLTCNPLGTSPNACTDSSTTRNFASNGNFQLMDNNFSSNNWNANGKIGMFRIFNTSITESEALANFNATKSSYPVAVSYAAGGGTGSGPSSPTTAVYGSTFTTPANTYTRTGYTFAGWSDGSNTYAAGATYPASGTASGNVTLTATWTADTTTTTTTTTTSTTTTTTTTTTSTTVPTVATTTTSSTTTTLRIPRPTTTTSTPTPTTTTIAVRSATTTSFVVATTTPIYERPGADTTSTTTNVPPTTVPTQPSTGPEPGFVTSDDEVEVLIQGVDENEIPSLVNPEGRLVLTVGNFLKVRGRGFTNAGTAEVWLFSTPQLLGRVPKDDSGNFIGRVRIPAGIEPGEHTVELRAKTRRGRIVMVSIPAIVIGGTRLEFELDGDNSSETPTSLGGNADNPSSEDTNRKTIEIEPGATEVVVPIDTIVEVVSSLLPSNISPVDTEVEVRTPSVSWQLVDITTSAPVVLPLSNDTTAVEVQATTSDGEVFGGSIPIAVREKDNFSLTSGFIGAIVVVGIFALWLIIWRRRRDDDDNRDRS